MLVKVAWVETNFSWNCEISNVASFPHLQDVSEKGNPCARGGHLKEKTEKLWVGVVHGWSTYTRVRYPLEK